MQSFGLLVKCLTVATLEQPVANVSRELWVISYIPRLAVGMFGPKGRPCHLLKGKSDHFLVLSSVCYREPREVVRVST